MSNNRILLGHVAENTPLPARLPCGPPTTAGSGAATTTAGSGGATGVGLLARLGAGLFTIPRLAGVGAKPKTREEAWCGGWPGEAGNRGVGASPPLDGTPLLPLLPASPGMAGTCTGAGACAGRGMVIAKPFGREALPAPTSVRRGSASVTLMTTDPARARAPCVVFAD